MTRIVSVWLPRWPIERLRRSQGLAGAPDEAAFVLVEADARGLTIAAANDSALRDGLQPGLSLADARARHPGLRSAPAQAAEDGRALLRLARWCGRYGPRVNIDGTDGLWIDVTGVAHLFGGEAGLLADMAARFAGLDLTARVALADTLGAAWALSRYAPSHPCAKKGGPGAKNGSPAPPAVAPPHAQAQELARLPVAALRLAPGATLLLRRLGLKHIGQLYALPRASLARRFRSKNIAEVVLARLDQALGLRPEPLPPLTPPSLHEARLAFPEPLICDDAFQTALARLVEALCQQLARALAGARRIAFTAYRSDGTHALARAGLSAPSRAPGHLLRLLGEKTKALDLGFGVDVMTLAATAVERLGTAQTAFAEATTRPPPDLLIDRLSSRLGAAGVLRPAAKASHVPERAQAWRPALAPLPARWQEPPGAKPPRPALLLDRPEPIAVVAEVPEGPPARFTWRRVTRRVVRAEGPERIAPEWWRRPVAPAKDHDARTRDYYRIEDEAGGRYWVFRAGLYGADTDDAPPAWYLHGLFA